MFVTLGTVTTARPESEKKEIMSVTAFAPVSLERMYRAVEKVRERVRRAAALLEAAGIPYAVIGGNAVEAWVSRVDESAVRATKDVDVLLRREDLQRAIEAFERSGFVHRHSASIDMFLDGPGATPRDAVHVVFAGERVRPEHVHAAPDVSECDGAGDFRVLSLEALVRMKLNSFRDRDRTHLRDMLDVGLIDAEWVPRFPAPLSERLQMLIDSPDG